ncbi:MAG TPA: ribonuclease J [Patescibacteria group bacterium]|nr:ribonuclease J [Patescibacteria group bacterium]
MTDQLSLIPLGGTGDVTKNMYLYEYKDQMLIVDCGLGFADETMLGVDLLLPDISYLLKTNKKIVGMLFTHGHEDHIGALPFVLPQLSQNFPIFGTPLTAAFANEKLKEFGTKDRVQTVKFNEEKILGDFKFSFVRVTHSVPDTSHIFIETPIGNFYHGSDFKLDPTPYDKNTTDFARIEELSKRGVLCLLSDSLGAERKGRTPSEFALTLNFENEIKKCNGKFIVTTYSSNIARLNQVIEASEKVGRKVAFVGRSLIKAVEISKSLGYLRLKPGTEIRIDQIKNFKDRDLTLVIAGSQGQENSAMTRISNGEHREVKLGSNDVVIFSADPIPGNEISVYELVDTIVKKDVRVVYSSNSSDFHVSGHGSQDELSDLIKMVKPKKLIPIGGTPRHMYAYKNMAMDLGYKREDVLLLDDGQEVIFGRDSASFGKIVPLKNVYVDEVSGEEMESFVLRDRQKLSEGGIVIILAQVSSSDGQLVDNPDIIIRGFTVPDGKKLTNRIVTDLRQALSKNRKRVTNWQYIKKYVGEIAEKRISKDLRHQPLVLPVVIEV